MLINRRLALAIAVSSLITRPSHGQSRSTRRFASLNDVPYGPHARQRYDVHLPAQAKGAPIVFFVHGGGWRHGDKAGRGVISAKAAHWCANGTAVVSANYRLLPDADPLQQAQDVAQAIRHVRAHASAWGGDPDRMVLIGHSAGAHLVALVNADPVAFGFDRPAWLGAVLLDSAGLDIEAVMTAPRRLGLYDDAFGNDPAFWQRASPRHRLTPAARPWLSVCAADRTTSCTQSRLFERASAAVSVPGQVMPIDKSHRQINVDLGEDPVYTQAVDRFLDALPGFRRPGG